MTQTLSTNAKLLIKSMFHTDQKYGTSLIERVANEQKNGGSSALQEVRQRAAQAGYDPNETQKYVSNMVQGADSSIIKTLTKANSPHSSFLGRLGSDIGQIAKGTITGIPRLGSELVNSVEAVKY